jgi:hypothetical protein
MVENIILLLIFFVALITVRIIATHIRDRRKK